MFGIGEPERFWESPKHEPKQAICMEKPLETAWVGPYSGWGVFLGNHQGQASSVSTIDGAADVVLASWLCWGGISKGAMASANISVLKKAAPPPSSCPEA